MMKKQKLYALLVMFFASLLSLPLMAAQEKRPTLMILPSDNWCAQRYFTTTFQNQGVQTVVPDYPTAFREDTELGGVISKVGELLTGLGYSLKDCEQEFKAMQSRIAEDNVAMSKTGASLVESTLDMLKRRTKSDIIIQIGWQVNKESNGHSVTFAMEAFDAYTSKRIATASGTSVASQEIVPVLLENAVMQKITDFDTQMTQYYADLQANGREIVMTIRCWDSWGNDLETEYNGEELLDCIQNWLNDNTVNSAFNLTDATETMAQFEQIRIPFFDENGKAMDARVFATRLRKYLQQQYQITAKVMVRGLGEANIILGEK
jgi:hypothetical protein